MSDGVEQITKPEENKASTPKREKDPKKVAAGKKLAEYNMKAREAYVREKNREAEMKRKSVDTSSAPEGADEVSTESWIPELSFSTVLSLVGLGFTAFQLYMTYGRRSNEVFDWQPVTTVFNREPAATSSKIPVPIPPKDTPQDAPKIGML